MLMHWYKKCQKRRIKCVDIASRTSEAKTLSSAVCLLPLEQCSYTRYIVFFYPIQSTLQDLLLQQCTLYRYDCIYTEQYCCKMPCDLIPVWQQQKIRVLRPRKERTCSDPLSSGFKIYLSAVQEETQQSVTTLIFLLTNAAVPDACAERPVCLCRTRVD